MARRMTMLFAMLVVLLTWSTCCVIATENVDGIVDTRPGFGKPSPVSCNFRILYDRRMERTLLLLLTVTCHILPLSRKIFS
jgi:hypothetical protein